MVGYVHPDGHDDAFHEAYMKVEAEKTANDPKNWIFRDPLRKSSVDRWPYARSADELRLDFVFKAGTIYGPCLAITAILESPVFFVLVGLWFTINFFRRNG